MNLCSKQDIFQHCRSIAINNEVTFLVISAVSKWENVLSGSVIHR